ncbi:hypothetical protein GCM10010916_03580 [Paenibacillus abyssi]|uniref:GH18 domain-containing protein n=1 Tax=Paenibacillus abyssi TaxID=1340531 RepID=A0A917FMB1_9BACL|nr:hypothetical protein GCM10010916_03580 [Paenibacillus abyssi]
MSAAAAVNDARMTKFRVYQNDKALREFATQQQAVNYAKQFAYSHVEKIAGRIWVWDNFPKYKLYQNGMSRSAWEFQSYEEAVRKAKTLKNVHIRDVEKPGWVYSNHTNYQLYQGDKTTPQWGFAALEEAKKEAKRWKNVHVMDTASNQWVWDNLTVSQKKSQRASDPVYEIFIDNISTGDKYSFLYDAITAASEKANSEVVNTHSSQIVHSNIPPYRILQNGREIKAFFGLEQAVHYAKGFANAEIVRDNNVWWTNKPYYQVKQGDKVLRSVHSRSSAVTLASKYANSSVMNSDGRVLWNNGKKLLYLGWNGSSRTSTIMNQLANTQGLDIDSPTWFELADAEGTLTDTSDPALAQTLRNLGIQLVPLVHNQFDPKLTSAFLRNNKAQAAFIKQLVSRLTALRANGINLDFESIAGADRDLYTSFVRKLTAAAHKEGLSVSIDLPRGSLAWNHLTAYDHEKLAGIVDYIIIMAYDQHWTGSISPGSVAGLKWTEEGVQEFLSYGIPRSKLMLGVPFYVREWKLDASGKLVGNRTLLMKDIPALLASEQVTSSFDPEFGQTKYTYRKDGYTYLFWAETATTVKARIDITKKYDLAGIAAWRLGYEQSDIWTMMLREK